MFEAMKGHETCTVIQGNSNIILKFICESVVWTIVHATMKQGASNIEAGFYSHTFELNFA